jgi:hypothetical protein
VWLPVMTFDGVRRVEAAQNHYVAANPPWGELRCDFASERLDACLRHRIPE